jgi:hypothetical protein
MTGLLSTNPDADTTAGAREVPELVHFFDPREHPYAFCGTDVGDDPEVVADDELVDCVVCVEIARTRPLWPRWVGRVIDWWHRS